MFHLLQKNLINLLSFIVLKAVKCVFYLCDDVGGLNDLIITI